MCVQACPFGNSVWDELTHKILKCDYCGGDPACAKFCPTHAIDWIDDVVATRTRKRAFAEKFKEAFTE
jgi:Fe-S-cluster-containing hydrogenase component 2